MEADLSKIFSIGILLHHLSAYLGFASTGGYDEIKRKALQNKGIKMARIVFFGTPLFARKVLEIVAEVHEIVGIVTQPDRPFGRTQTLKISEVKEYALAHAIPYFQPLKLETSLLETLQTLKADFFLVVAFGQIFPKAFLQALPCINIHASILPHLRGASPLQEMILQDQKKFGVSAMRMEEGLDSGEILGISVLDSKEDYDLSSLASILAELGGKLASRVLEEFFSLKALKQRDCDATFCKKIKKEQGRIAFLDAREIWLKFLAFRVWPSLFLDNGLKLLELRLDSLDGAYQEGEILAIQRESVIVGCQRGRLEIFQVQPFSKQKMQAIDYLRGRRLGVGDIFC